MKKFFRLLKGDNNEPSTKAPSPSTAETRKLNAQLSSKVRNPSIIPGSFFERDQKFKENSSKGGTKAIVQPLTQGPVEFKQGKFSSWTPAWAKIEGSSLLLYPLQPQAPPSGAVPAADNNNNSSSDNKINSDKSESLQQQQEQYIPQGAPIKKIQLVGSHLAASKAPQEFTISESAPGGVGGGGTSSSPHGSTSGTSISIKACTAGQRDQWMVAFGRIPGIFRRAEDYYVLGRQWGHGATSEAIEVIGKFTLKKLALKRRLQDTKEATLAMHNELRILQICAKHPHPAIPILEDFFFSTSGRIELVMQLMQGGELFDWIASRDEHLTETDAKLVFRQVVSGVAHLHSLGIAHRDLKPQNLMYVTASEGAGEGAMIKIMDYDLARVNYAPEWEGSTPCGTVYYMAPEVVRREKYSLAIDCWSLGVLLYILLSGCMPFTGKDDAEIEKAIKNGEYSITGELWGDVSEEAKDLVQKLLKMDPSERLTAAECLEHPWLRAEEEIEETVGVGGGAAAGISTNSTSSAAVATEGKRRSSHLSSPQRSLRTVQNLRQLSGSLSLHESSGGGGGGGGGSLGRDGDLQQAAAAAAAVGSGSLDKGADYLISSSPNSFRSPLSKALDYNLHPVRQQADSRTLKESTTATMGRNDEMDKDLKKDSDEITNLRLTLELVGTEAGIVDSKVARATGAGKELVGLPASPTKVDAPGRDEERDIFADLDAAFVEEEEHRMGGEVEEEE